MKITKQTGPLSKKPNSEANIKEQSPLQIVIRRFIRHKLAIISFIVMLFLFLVILFSAQIAPFKPDDLNVANAFLPFGAINPASGKIHLLGTDNIGRDYFSRLLYAGRISLSIAFFSVILSEIIGILMGALAGYFKGWVDAVIMRLVEFLITIPSLPLLLIISSMLMRNENLIDIPKPILEFVGQIILAPPRDARQAIYMVMVLSGLGWVSSAQLMRGQILSLREQTYVEASRALGGSSIWIILRHMIPNSLAPVIVDASLALAGYVVSESTLSFLGFGIQDPIPTWGNMLAAGQQFMFDRPWLPLICGFPIFLCSLAFNYIGDGLRDALDPRLKL